MATPDPQDNDETLLQTALNHAQSWVEVHTSQRQNLLNFFLIAIAFLFNAYVSALNSHHYFLAGTIGLLGTIISLGFTAMDLRNRDLTRAGEIALKDIEDRFALRYQISSLRIVAAIDRPRHIWLSMGKIIRTIYLSIGVVFFCATIYSFLK